MALTCKTLPLQILALLILALAAAPAAADSRSLSDERSMLERAFDATIVSTYPDGRQAELWLQRDGSYKMESRSHARSDGRWQVKGDKLCLRQSHPLPAPFSFCTPAPASLDRAWTAKAFTGEIVTLRLVEGVKGRNPASANDNG